MEITISGKDKKPLKQVETLAKRLGLDIIKPLRDNEEEANQRSEKLYQLMQEMAASGGIKSIQNPIAWQREVREDKKLYGRD